MHDRRDVVVSRLRRERRQPLRLALFAASLLALAGCGSITRSIDALPAARPARIEPAPVVPAEPRHAPPAVVVAPAALPVEPAPRMPATPPARPTPDATPRVERIPQGPPNEPYAIGRQHYRPGKDDAPLFETGIASWYGEPFHGRRTATGEIYDMNRMTAAHKTMPLPSYALVRNRANGRQVVVRINDRGPFKPGRIIDLSRAAARKLRIDGLAPVEVRRLTHDDIRSGAWKSPAPNALAIASP